MRIFIDIETIPGETKPKAHEVSAPANYKDPEKIRAYQESNVDDAYRKQSLDSMTGRIWCIGVAIDDGPVTAWVDNSERALLEHLSDYVKEADPAHKEITWVGHNAAGFDMKWIWRRAIKYDLPYLLFYIQNDRYRGNIKDTMLMWSCGDSRDYVSLDKLARFLGLGNKTSGMDGSKVYDLWMEDKQSECAEYCKQDVALTRAVYRKLISD
jgi:hypothetical protein